jgi:hypothetical protein
MRRASILLAGLIASLLLAGHMLRGAVRQTLPPIAMWGDSQTAEGSGYGASLAALMPERRSYNLGIGGQRLEMIAARMGAVPVTLRREIALPASGSVRLSPEDLSIDLLRAPSGVLSMRVDAGGVPCVLTYQAGASSSQGVYLLARSNPAEAPTTFRAGTALRVLSASVAGDDAGAAEPLDALLGGVVIVRAGRNDLNDPSYDITRGMGLMDRIVTQAERHGRRIIIAGQMLGYGDLPAEMGGGSPNAERSAAVLGLQARWNQELARSFPAYYADVQAYHVARGGGAAVSLMGQGGPVRYTVLTKDAKVPALRDGVHENVAGQQQTAEQMRQIIAARHY